MQVIKDSAALLGVFVVLMWGFEILDLVTNHYFDRFGIQPRKVGGLIGLVAAPFLHGDFQHLISNTIPFLVLGGIVMLGGRGVFVAVTIFIALVGGGALWLFGPGGNTNHIGASLVIFGYLGFLLSRGFFEKSIFWVLVSFGILVFYGYLIFGVLPGEPGISWQGHLFGFIAGIVSAKLLFSKEKTLYQ